MIGQLKENIAFGVNKNEIDNEKIKELILKTNLRELIDSLPEKENTKVGERGVKLSGGQQQRIGIARALYNNPNILILDEATNSLDNISENEIIETLKNFNENISIIMISHKTDVIKKFNKIIFLNNGSVEGIGSFDDLIKSNNNFQNLISSNKEKIMISLNSFTKIPYKNKVIVTDGMIGGGKTLIANLISSLKNVDPWIYDSNVERFCALNKLKKITKSTSSELIRKKLQRKIF